MGGMGRRGTKSYSGVLWGFFSFLETDRRENSPGCLILVCRISMDVSFVSDPTLGCHKQLTRADGANPTLFPLFFPPFPLIRNWFAPASHLCPRAETPQVLPICVPRRNMMGSSSGWGAHQHPWVPAGCRRLQLHGKENGGCWWGWSEGRSCAVVNKLGFILFFSSLVCQKLLVEVEASSLGVG